MDRPAHVLCVGGEGDGIASAPAVLDRAEAPLHVERASDGDEAVRRVEAGEVDCLVCPTRLSDGDGLSVLEAVSTRAPDLPVVCLVAESDPATLARDAVERGATDYVRTGDVAASPALLVRAVTGAVEGHRRDRALEQYRGLVGTVGDPMYVLDPDGTITFVNDAMLEMLGCAEDDVVGLHASETMGDGDFERGTEVIRSILEDPDRDWGTYEVTVEPFDGESIPAEVNVAPLLDGGSSYRATVGVVRDISDRKLREQRLSALHDTTRRLIEATNVETVIEIGIEAAAEVLELEIAAFYRPIENGDVLAPVAATRGARELFDEVPSFERPEGLIWQAFDGGEPIFAENVREVPGAYNPDTPIGSEMLIPAGEHGVFLAATTEAHGFDGTDEELAGVLVSNLSRAIESVRREDRLRERERELEQYETMVRAIPDEIYTLDANGRFTSVVPPVGSSRATSGFEPDELVGEHVSRVMDEGDVETGREIIEDLVRSDSRDRASFEMDVVTRSGDRIPHESHVALLPTDGDADFRGTVGVLRDITERRQRERELKRQNERLEQFAHIASHDLRAPLSVADGRLALASEECDSEHLDHVHRAIERMETLVEDTLTMAKEGRTVSNVEPVDLANLAIRCWDAVAGEAGQLDVVDDVTVRADADRLQRLIENLFRNALEHCGPDVTVRLGALDGDGFYVGDDGPGIPEDQRSAVFTAGHTTDDDGTGFGLAIVKEIVEAHGWTIDVAESEAGGARFEITGVDVA